MGHSKITQTMVYAGHLPESAADEAIRQLEESRRGRRDA